jgi:single-stranded DNA-binding protein
MSINYQLVGIGGNLTVDVKVFKDSVAKFNIATNTGFGEKRNVAFINCVVFKNTLSEKSWELLTKLVKGSNIGVEGKFVTNSFEKDGKKTSNLELLVSSFNLLYNKKSTSESEETTSQEVQPAKGKSQLETEEDEIPF